MARPRHLTPSPAAIKMRARRGDSADSDPAGYVSLADDLPDAPGDAPAIPSSTNMAEAVRLRAVYDARKARLSSEMEQLRLDIERRRMLTRDQVINRDARRDDLVMSRLPELIDAAVSLHPPEQQPTVRQKLSVSLADFRRALADQLRNLG